MEITLTYIHHSSFVLQHEELCLLFDYPAVEHRPPDAENAAIDAVRGRDLIVVHSHGHDDHFDPDPAPVARAAKSVRRIVSYDIAELSDEAFSGQDSLVVEPEEVYEWSDLAVAPMDSNDLGCALILQHHGLRIYYSGDLALWDWERASEAERAFTERFFAQAMEHIAEARPHVAFAVADPRLESRAGALQFVHAVRPGLFVPMHTFGQTHILPGLAAQLDAPGTRVFLYEKPGDSESFTLEATP